MTENSPSLEFVTVEKSKEKIHIFYRVDVGKRSTRVCSYFGCPQRIDQ